MIIQQGENAEVSSGGSMSGVGWATLRCATIADRLWTVECLVAEFGIMEGGGGSLSWSEEVDSTEYSPTTLYESGSFAILQAL